MKVCKISQSPVGSSVGTSKHLKVNLVFTNQYPVLGWCFTRWGCKVWNRKLCITLLGSKKTVLCFKGNPGNWSHHSFTGNNVKFFPLSSIHHFKTQCLTLHVGIEPFSVLSSMQTLALSLYLLFSDAESKITFWALFDLELKVVSTLFLDSVF